MYELIDEKLKKYYINYRKCVFLIGIFLVFVLAILSFFNSIAIIFMLIMLMLDMVFLLSWLINRKKYGNKLSYYNGIITVYKYNGLKLREFKYDSMKTKFMQIAFDEYPKFSYKKCLIIFSDMEPYENMEYRSYAQHPQFIIIQNPFLIKMINDNNISG